MAPLSTAVQKYNEAITKANGAPHPYTRAATTVIAQENFCDNAAREAPPYHTPPQPLP